MVGSRHLERDRYGHGRLVVAIILSTSRLPIFGHASSSHTALIAGTDAVPVQLCTRIAEKNRIVRRVIFTFLTAILRFIRQESVIQAGDQFLPKNWLNGSAKCRQKKCGSRSRWLFQSERKTLFHSVTFEHATNYAFPREKTIITPKDFLQIYEQ